MCFCSSVKISDFKKIVKCCLNLNVKNVVKTERFFKGFFLPTESVVNCDSSCLCCLCSRLQDGSSMLIEAAKGGHTNVVSYLLDYPNNILSVPAPDLSQLTPPSQDPSQVRRPLAVLSCSPCCSAGPGVELCAPLHKHPNSSARQHKHEMPPGSLHLCLNKELNSANSREFTHHFF